MRTMLILLSASFSGFIVGQTNGVEGWIKSAAELSAVGALITMLIFLLKVYIPSRDKAAAKQQEAANAAMVEQQKAFTTTLDKTSDRHDAWEKLRHEDSTALNVTLLTFSKNCAEAQAAMRVEGVSNKGPGG